jgi:hypothetical protein
MVWLASILSRAPQSFCCEIVKSVIAQAAQAMDQIQGKPSEHQDVWARDPPFMETSVVYLVFICWVENS